MNKTLTSGSFLAKFLILKRIHDSRFGKCLSIVFGGFSNVIRELLQCVGSIPNDIISHGNREFIIQVHGKEATGREELRAVIVVIF